MHPEQPAFIDYYAAFGDNYYIGLSGSQVPHDQAYCEASGDEREGRLKNRSLALPSIVVQNLFSE